MSFPPPVPDLLAALGALLLLGVCAEMLRSRADDDSDDDGPKAA